MAIRSVLLGDIGVTILEVDWSLDLDLYLVVKGYLTPWLITPTENRSNTAGPYAVMIIILDSESSEWSLIFKLQQVLLFAGWSRWTNAGLCIQLWGGLGLHVAPRLHTAGWPHCMGYAGCKQPPDSILFPLCMWQWKSQLLGPMSAC